VPSIIRPFVISRSSLIVISLPFSVAAVSQQNIRGFGTIMIPTVRRKKYYTYIWVKSSGIRKFQLVDVGFIDPIFLTYKPLIATRPNI